MKLSGGKISLDATSIEQLFCEERFHRDEHGRATHSKYAVWAATKEGDTIQLFPGLGDPQQALYIEQAIEEALGIVDVETALEWDGKGGPRSPGVLG